MVSLIGTHYMAADTENSPVKVLSICKQNKWKSANVFEK